MLRVKQIIISLPLIFTFTILTAQFTFSQENPLAKRLVLSVEPRYGFIAPHHDYMQYFLEKHVSGFQLNVGLLTPGNKQWHRDYNYPQVGAGIYHSNLGNNKIFGKLTGLYLYIDRRFLPINHRFNIGNKLSFGVSHITKHYDVNSNPYDVVVSTPINVFIQYDLVGYYRLSPNLNMRLFLGFTHASNGNIKEPNKGFNIVTTSLGLQYAFSDERKIIIKDALPEPSYENRSKFYLGIISGRKSTSRFDNQLYYAAGISAEYQRVVSTSSLIGLETTAYWDDSMEKEFEMDNNEESFKRSDHINVTVNPLYALVLGKILITFQPGLYIKCSYGPYGFWSNKIGIRYSITPKLQAGMAIKAHWVAQADFVEFGIKYNILRSKINL